MRRFLSSAGVAALALSMAACGASHQNLAISEPGAAIDGSSSGEVRPKAPPRGDGDGDTSLPAARPEMNTTAALAYAQGLQSFGYGDLAAAKLSFQRAIDSDPRAYQAYYSLGLVEERLGEERAALASYRKSLDIVPDFEPSIVAHALLEAGLGRTREAEAFLDARRIKMPDSALVLAALAEVKSISGDTASAQRLAQEALKKDPSCADAMVTIARDHYRQRRIDLALYAIRAIVDGFGDHDPPRDKDNAEAHYLRALVRREEGQRGPAIEAFKRVVDLRPDLVDARVALAQYYLEAGNPQDALPLLEGAARYRADHIPARLALGDCYRLLGRIAEARAQLEWVLERDPSVLEAHYNLALLYLFSPNISGMDAKDQANAAIAEIEKYQKKRGRLADGDDSTELLNRARQRLADIEAQLAVSEPMPMPDETDLEP